MRPLRSMAVWVANLFGVSKAPSQSRSSTNLINDHIYLQTRIKPNINWDAQLEKLDKLQKKTDFKNHLNAPVVINNINTEKTLMHFAAQEGRLEIAEKLFAYDVDLFLRDGNGFSPFDLAERNNHIDMARLIALQMYKHSPLHLSAFNNDVENMKKIIAEDEEIISHQDKFGNSVLHVAASHNSAHIIKDMLRHMYTPSNEQEKSADQEEHIIIDQNEESLEKKHAPQKLIHLVKLCNNKNLTAFQLAVLRGHKIAAYTLLTETQCYAKPTSVDVRALSVGVRDEQFENDLLLLCNLEFISSETITSALKEKSQSFYSKELRTYVEFLRKDEESASMPQ